MRDQFLTLLVGEVGQHEGRDPNGAWNNRQKYSRETPGLEWSDGQPWCATFECWAALKAGMQGRFPVTASCSTAVQWWQDAGRWSPYPVLGGPFYLGPGGGTHTGVVIGWDADNIHTVEGNSNSGGSPEGDGVYLRTRPRRGPNGPYGYGVPDYPEGVVSADPKYGGTSSAAFNPQEDDMTLTQDDLNKIAAAVWGAGIPNPDGSAQKSAGTILAWTDKRHDAMFGEVQRVEAAVKALATSGASADAIAAAVRVQVEQLLNAFLSGASVHVEVNGSAVGA